MGKYIPKILQFKTWTISLKLSVLLENRETNDWNSSLRLEPYHSKLSVLLENRETNDWDNPERSMLANILSLSIQNLKPT